MELVYVLGIASANQRPRPFTKPRPSALTRSRTIRPSRRATATLRTVRRTRKNECETNIKASLERHEGKAIRRIASNWRRKVLSRLGLCDAGTSGNRFAFFSITEVGVGLTVTCQDPCELFQCEGRPRDYVPWRCVPCVGQVESWSRQARRRRLVAMPARAPPGRPPGAMRHSSASRAHLLADQQSCPATEAA